MRFSGLCCAKCDRLNYPSVKSWDFYSYLVKCGKFFLSVVLPFISISSQKPFSWRYSVGRSIHRKEKGDLGYFLLSSCGAGWIATCAMSQGGEDCASSPSWVASFTNWLRTAIDPTWGPQSVSEVPTWHSRDFAQKPLATPNRPKLPQSHHRVLQGAAQRGGCSFTSVFSVLWTLF